MILTVGPWRYILFGLVCAGTFTVGTVGGLLHDDGRLARGLAIESVDVGGLTPEEAEAAVHAALVKPLTGQVELLLDSRRWRIGDDKFGRRADVAGAVRAAAELTRTGPAWQRATTRLTVARQGRVLPLPVVADRTRLEALLGQLATEIDEPPRDARVSRVIGRRLYFLPERPGRSLDIQRSAEAILRHGAWPPVEHVALVVRTEAPKVTLTELRTGLNCVLASHTTNMNRHYTGVMRANRKHNVALLLERLNTGQVVLPGAEWSFNRALGERRAEDGFKQSVIFLRRPDGTIDEEWDTGGGICQLATTLFNAIVKANLKIAERHNHSKTVSYAEPGRDATVYYGVADLRFVNSLTHPVLLWGELNDAGGDLTITVIGDARDDCEVELFSSSWAGKTGRGGSFWRTVKTPAGEVLKEREHLCNSFYPYPKEPAEAKPNGTGPAAPTARPAAPTARPAAPAPAAPAAAVERPAEDTVEREG